MAKNLSLNMSERRDDVELSQRASGGDSGTAQACQVVAIGMRDTLDEAQATQWVQLTR